MKIKVIRFLACLFLLVVGISAIYYGVTDFAQYLYERHSLIRSIEN